MTWKECAKLPIKLSEGKTSVINGKVYCGGGVISDDDDDDGEYTVYCYDPPQDKWMTLPQLPVRYFGLGQVNGKLVAVGGIKSSRQIYTYDNQSQEWKQTIPPMPTARDSSCVLSVQSTLVVAGGVTPSIDYTDTVEIFKPDTSQWYKTDPLPKCCCDVSLVTVGNICYEIGGCRDLSHLNQAFYASVDDLLCNDVPANETIHCGHGDTQSAWKTLPNTPTYGPAAAVLAGNLLAIGGTGTSSYREADKKEVYMYSPSTNSWVYISDLPAPRSNTATAVLSSTEILVIGGQEDGDYVNTVYKGTLHLKV